MCEIVSKVVHARMKPIGSEGKRECRCGEGRGTMEEGGVPMTTSMGGFLCSKTSTVLLGCTAQSGAGCAVISTTRSSATACTEEPCPSVAPADIAGTSPDVVPAIPLVLYCSQFTLFACRTVNNKEYARSWSWVDKD